MKTLKQIIITATLTICVIFTVNSSAKNYVDDAQQYIGKGEYKAAIIQLKNQLKENPKDANARLLLGKSYLKTGNIKQADKEIVRAYQLNPANEELVLTYAQVLLLQRNYKKVNEVLDRKLSDAGNENQRLIYKAYAFLGQNQLVDAKQIFSKLTKQSENLQVYNGLAKIAVLEKEMDVAEQWLEKSLKIEPENTDALQTKARVEIAKQHFTKALTIYDNLIRKQENNLSLYLNRAAIKIQLKDLQGAEKDIQKVLKKIKNQPQANYMLAQIKLQEGNYQASQLAAQNVLNVMPRHSNSMLILGIANFGRGNYNQADKYLTQYLSVNPNNIAVQNILANVYLAQNKSEQALLILESIDEEKINQSAKILMTLGSAYLLMGDYQKGVNLLNKARELEPESAEILKRLTAGQFQTGDIDQAISGLEKMVDSGQGNYKTSYLLIITYIQRNEIEKADVKLNELMKKNPDDPVLYNLKGALEGIKGNIKQSRLAYGKAIALDKKYIPAYIGLGKEAISRNDFEQASDYFKKIIGIDKSYNRAYIALATIAEKENKPAEAENYLRAAYENAKIKSQHIAAATLLGKWYVSKQQLKKLLALAKDLVGRYPEDKQALSFLVGAHLNNNNSTAAKSVLQRIIGRYSNDTKHRLLLVGLLNKEAGHEEEILILLDEVIQIKPNSPEPLKIKAAYLLENKQFDESLNIAKRCTQIFPNSSVGHQLEGNVYMAQNQVNKALSAYKKGYEIQAENKLMFIITGILENQGRQSEAIDFLQSELRKNSKNIGIHFKLANIYQKNKNIEGAIKHYQAMLDVKSDSILAMNNLAWIYFLQGNKKALVLSEKAFKKAPNLPKVSDTYGYILVKSGHLDKGLNILEQSAKKAPADNNIRYHLAEGYYLNGDYHKSRQLLAAILKSGKNDIVQQKAGSLLEKVNLKL